MTSRMSPGKVVLALSPVKTIISVPGKVVRLHYTSVYCACLSAVLVSFRLTLSRIATFLGKS